MDSDDSGTRWRYWGIVHLKWFKGLFYAYFTFIFGFPGGLDSKESAGNEGDPGSISGCGRFPGEGNVSLSGKSHGQRSLADHSPWGRRVGHD